MLADRPAGEVPAGHPSRTSVRLVLPKNDRQPLQSPRSGRRIARP
jgi:hypothetical protein